MPQYSQNLDLLGVWIGNIAIFHALFQCSNYPSHIFQWVNYEMHKLSLSLLTFQSFKVNKSLMHKRMQSVFSVADAARGG